MTENLNANIKGNKKMLTKNTDTLKIEVAAHIKADAVTRGEYWVKADNAVGGKGCFIACLSHSDDPEILTEKYGIPIELTRVIEGIHDDLTDEGSVQFFADIANAIGHDGKDLSLVVWKFLHAELKALPEQKESIQAVIDPVIEGIGLKVQGEEWDKDAARAAADAAARAAAYAAHAARAAADAAARAARAAADAAARAAAYAAHAADAAAARTRQAETILKLIAEA